MTKANQAQNESQRAKINSRKKLMKWEKKFNESTIDLQKRNIIYELLSILTKKDRKIEKSRLI